MTVVTLRVGHWVFFQHMVGVLPVAMREVSLKGLAGRTRNWAAREWAFTVVGVSGEAHRVTVRDMV